MRYMKYILLAALAILLANTAYADDPHGTVIEYGTPTIYYNEAARREVRAAAAGQTNFKATPKLQWNAGSAFNDSESALNFQIGYQVGSVFITGGVTDNTDTLFTKDSNPLYTINAGGVF